MLLFLKKGSQNITSNILWPLAFPLLFGQCTDVCSHCSTHTVFCTQYCSGNTVWSFLNWAIHNRLTELFLGVWGNIKQKKEISEYAKLWSRHWLFYCLFFCKSARTTLVIDTFTFNYIWRYGWVLIAPCLSMCRRGKAKAGG